MNNPLLYKFSSDQINSIQDKKKIKQVIMRSSKLALIVSPASLMLWFERQICGASTQAHTPFDWFLINLRDKSVEWDGEAMMWTPIASQLVFLDSRDKFAKWPMRQVGISVLNLTPLIIQFFWSAQSNTNQQIGNTEGLDIVIDLPKICVLVMYWVN